MPHDRVLLAEQERALTSGYRRSARRVSDRNASLPVDPATRTPGGLSGKAPLTEASLPLSLKIVLLSMQVHIFHAFRKPGRQMGPGRPVEFPQTITCAIVAESTCELPTTQREYHIR